MSVVPSGNATSGNIEIGGVQVKSIKTIRFDGNEKNWREWSRKALAYLKQQGWSEALLNPSNADDEAKAIIS